MGTADSFCMEASRRVLTMEKVNDGTTRVRGNENPTKGTDVFLVFVKKKVHPMFGVICLYCSRRKKKCHFTAKGEMTSAFSGRDDLTRTGDHCVPNAVRYQLRYIPFWLLYNIFPAVTFFQLLHLGEIGRGFYMKKEYPDGYSSNQSNLKPIIMLSPNMCSE